MLNTTKKILWAALLGGGLSLTGSSFAQTSDLLISEYVEGTSNNKYIEIYNGTGAAVNLANYQLRLYSNGSNAPSITNTLSGSLANGSVIVYRNSAATIYAGTAINLTSMQYNGNDAVELYKISTGQPVDIFGVKGCDPGTQWISASNRTLDRTLRRKSNILAGVTVNPSCTSSSGDFTSLESQWTEFPTNDVSGLGNHSVVVLNPPVVNLGPDQTICTGSSITLFSGGDGTSFLWSTGATTQNIVVSTAGTYSVTVTNSDGSTTDAINISVYPPTALSASAPTSICSGGSTQICASVLTSDLIISEYVEGSNLDKCVEIYNGTGASVNLGTQGYAIVITFNGGTSSTTIPLTGIIAHGATHVLCDDDAAAAFINAANQTTNTSLWNGDDAIVLRKNGVAVDIFGVINDDPGAQWSSGGNSTQNTILRRNSSVTSGISSNPTGTGAGAFTTLGSEWTLAANTDDASNLGSHTVTGTGTFAWSTGATTLCTTVTPSTSSNYTFSYTSVEGCVTNVSTTVSVSTPVVPTISSTPILCNGGSSSITVTATGGTAPYTGTGNFTVSAGTHSYTVTDANGCSTSTTITVTEPTQVVASASSTPIACYGRTARITVSATGGTAPYTGTGTFVVPAGTYTYTVTDANGCSHTVSITVTQPSPLVVSTTSPSIVCYGGSAIVTVSATGGTTPYLGGVNTYTVTAGTYIYTVVDAKGCRSRDTITVTQPDFLGVTASSTLILCNGDSTDVTVAATGGTAPYTGTGIFWETAGIYTYTVTDANGCVDSTTIGINEPASVFIIVTSAPILCNGGTSQVSVTGPPGCFVSPGLAAGAGTYTFSAVDIFGCTADTTITITEPPLLVVSATTTTIDCNGGSANVTVSATGGTAPYSGTGNFTVGAGTHSFTVTDANGCTSDVSIIVDQPAQLTSSATATAILCNGGTSTVTVSAAGGTAPYSGTGNFTVGAGTYSYTVTDANGCTSDVSIMVDQPTQLTSSATATAILCSGGTSTVTVSAAGGTAPYSGIGNYTVSAGTYSYTVTDANGCSASTSITVSGGNSPIVDAGGCAVVYFGYAPAQCTTLNATSPSAVSYAWSNGANGASQVVCPQVTTNYTVTATDANGCTAQSSVTVNVVDVRCGKKNDKVMICQVSPGNPSNTQQLCVSPNAVPAHLANGSYLGPCGQVDPCTGIAKSNLTDNVIASQGEDFEMNIYPSPLVAGDMLNVAFSGIEEKVTVQLINLSGQIVGFTTVQSTGTNEQIVQLSTANLVDGIYLCKLTSEAGQISTKRFTVLR